MTVNNDARLQTVVKVERPLAAIKFKLNGVHRQNKGFFIVFFPILATQAKYEIGRQSKTHGSMDHSRRR